MQDLWAELNNEPVSPGSTIHEPSRHRRLTEQVILSSLRDWLLHDYVLPYCRALSATRIYRRCYWIDALGAIETRAARALSGSNTHTHSEAPAQRAKGSKKDLPSAIVPALQPIAALTDLLARESKPITLHGILLEAGSSKRKEARAAATGNGTDKPGTNQAKDAAILPGESGIARASWLEMGTTVLNLIDRSPAIFLLNPFGHTLFTYDDLAPLYQRTAPTELCLFISHKQVMTHLAASRDTTALTALLRSDRWKILPTNNEEVERTIEGVIDLLIASMQRHFLSVQRITFPVQVRPAVVETVPYTLIFATRRQDSMAAMNDAVCLYRRRLYEQSHRGVLGEEWFATQQQERFEEEMQQLYRHTLQQGHAQRVRRWPDLRQQLLNSNFGRYTIHEYDEVIQQMLAHGAVRCSWRRKSTEAEDAEKRVPGNDDTLIWQ
jgi:hypothetical protein